MVRQVRQARRTGDVQSGVRLVRFLAVLIAATAYAQDPAKALQQATEKSAAWQALANNLESKIARMLPCDARVRSAIEEVHKASDARQTALTAYLQAAAAQARRDAEAADAAMASEQAGAHDREIEEAESEQDRVAVEGELADLAASVKAKPALEAARKKLEAIAGSIRTRGADAKAQDERAAALETALKDLAAAEHARLKAFETELALLTAETARWSDYYAARIARAQTECSITNQTPARRRKQ
jgi:hypothetical protein